MKKVLPEYIVECFLMSGYDNSLSVLEMDISEQPGNSVEVIERYVDENKFENCMSSIHHRNQSISFCFPPGHHVLIKKVVKDIQEKHKTKNRSLCSNKPQAKKRKIKGKKSKTEDSEGESADEDDIPSVTHEIRTKIST